MEAKITLETWSGALAVPVARKQIDAAHLSAGQQAELARLLADPMISGLPEASSALTETRDGVHFKMVLQEQGKTKTVRVPGDKVSLGLQRLFDFIKSNASSGADEAGER